MNLHSEGCSPAIKTVNGVAHEYYYTDGQLTYEKVGDEYELFYFYDDTGRLVMIFRQILATKVVDSFYPICNTRGDLKEIRNAAGQVIVRYNYDAWGKITSITDKNGAAVTADHFANQISVRYRGYVYDKETGLYYLQSRYYDPETGRFLNADDAEYIGYSGGQLSYNAFAYCENEPVGCFDSDGLFVVKIKRFITTAIEKLLYGCIEIVEDNRTWEYTDKKTGKKYKIKVRYKYQIKVVFSEDLEFWQDIYNVYGKKFFDTLATIALKKFKEEIGRDFLFDKSLVKDELYVHLQGYLWALGINNYLPIRLNGFYAYYKIFDINEIKDHLTKACYEANIYEADIYLNRKEAQLLGFNYFNHIQECYRRKSADPYSNKYGKRSRSWDNLIERRNWLREKI